MNKRDEVTIIDRDKEKRRTKDKSVRKKVPKTDNIGDKGDNFYT